VVVEVALVALEKHKQPQIPVKAAPVVLEFKRISMETTTTMLAVAVAVAIHQAMAVATAV
jgi:hypothetical protein